ncbi:DEHA2B00990p [Debaryomyces hansenii CBS767]|uniref:DEHA2B00990p n=1 Tax=Debaryomyces hansenii (strain ATCC 36239 / CBS 767 / BCRC 21394 / JCM 1990 / NBRC 0083 / IGC 2968) TaxID=284592 RepID=B5RT16_DEBHA|nr:DEHA2B00990p [Debaryomyces hansenii CBS767]CAR65423.1 DEHA2B00990p [Debaryomyces hansenii CBS767]CUM51912.1 unnamed protein product [Debaryomyces tyrocola]|eukprot:XP_002770051.1 DEHA2B00990p [Debaryomyces hansenii CBS767]
MDVDSKLEVSNLPKGTTQDYVESIFLPFGNIVSIDITGNKALVHYEESEDCSSAIANMNGFDCNGTYLTVRTSRN